MVDVLVNDREATMGVAITDEDVDLATVLLNKEHTPCPEQL